MAQKTAGGGVDRPEETDGRLTPLQDNIRQIVYGGNDGIITTFAVVAGFAGLSAEGTEEVGVLAVLLFGLANLFADATSMGLGEYLSTRATQDVYRKVRRAHSGGTGDTLGALRPHLRARGMGSADVARLVEIIDRAPEVRTEMLTRYETGLSEGDGARPARRGLVTFVSFLVFGILPLMPYFLRPPGTTTFGLSILGTLVALTALGLLRWRSSDEGLARSLGETLLVGGVCALVAFAVGLAFR